MKKLVIGILAHVDAGKTTLSESLLYLTGTIRKLGRVDNRDAFLDTYELERARGITIFSKQAVFPLGDKSVTLMDTPGHVDFSTEMERTLQVLDYGILVISGADGIQGHTETLWRLLRRYGIPVFLFINKMDQEGADRERLMREIKARLDENCVDFGSAEDGAEKAGLWENLAMCDEGALEKYLETGTVEIEDIRGLIGERKVFPCYFGSALKMQGVEGFISGMEVYTRCPRYTEDFGAKVFKISRDEQGNRLTHMKITGGLLKVKDLLPGREEKVNQIRIYSGAKYEAVQEAESGTICAVTGPAETYPGQGMGAEPESDMPVLEPVLTYQMILLQDQDVHVMLRNLRQLEEEDPQLHIVWNEVSGEIQAQVMGEVQIEVLKSLIQERFGVLVEFGAGSIVYKETITEPVEGVGHFEPLRHYAEVHLLMEPLEPGMGLCVEARCSEDVLDRNWQRLILTHLEEKRHIGVLTGSEITDIKITLITGRAHLKHTEGGDFRQATYRAVRQGLMEAKCRLLEPYYDFCLEIPAGSVGRAMADIERMHGTCSPPQTDGGICVLRGSAPVADMRDYQTEVNAYAKGRGRLSCVLAGYKPCHNQDEIIALKAYDPESDPDNPTGSVFCSHGAGYQVPWNQVKEHMHVESPSAVKKEVDGREMAAVPNRDRKSGPSSSYGADDKELEAIFIRTYGDKWQRQPDRNGPRLVSWGSTEAGSTEAGSPEAGTAQAGQGKRERPDKKGSSKEPAEEYLLVDGYNIIFAWEELRELSQTTIDGARHRLMDILCNYQGYTKCTLIVVFDAYKVTGNTGQALDYHNIHVVYTKEAETADQYIEKLAHRIGRKYHVTVATSDGLEQLIIYGQGCHIMSAADLKEEVERVHHLIGDEQERIRPSGRNYLLEHAAPGVAEYLEDVRLGKK